MTDSELRFRVTGDASGGAAALRRMVSPLQQIKQTATQAKSALAGIKSTKATVSVDDAAVKRARDEIGRLRDEIAKKLQADVTADTRQAQTRIRQLESSIKLLSRQTITPKVNTSPLTRLKQLATSSLSSVASGVSTIGAGLSKVASNVGVPVIGALGVAAAGAATGVGLLAIKTLSLADRMENSNIAFTQFLGSAAKSSRFLQSLVGFAAKTPFEFPELVESSKQLLAFGVNSKAVIPIMTSFGDAAALTGQNVNDLVGIYGQMFAKGKVANEELLQLTERGIPAYQILASKLGVSVGEVQKLASEGKLGAKALALLRTGIDEKFGGGMAKQAKTLGGLVSTLKDTVTGILTDIGTSILPLAKSVFPLVQSGAENLGKRIKSLLPNLVNGIAGGLQSLLSLPGTLLRGLAGISQGFARMVSGIQTSTATLIAGIATALESLPAIFGKIDTSGLRNAALGLAQASVETNRVGQASFDGLTSAANKADAAVAPIKAKLEATRAAAAQQMKIDLATQAFDTKISAVDAKIKTYKEQRANAKLDADKTYFDRKIAAAKAEKKKLETQKTTVKIDGKIDALKAKVVSGKAELLRLHKQKTTPEVRARITELEAKVKSGKSKLSDLNKQRPTPRSDLNNSALNAAARSANATVDKLNGRKATIRIVTQYETKGRKAAGGGDQSGDFPLRLRARSPLTAAAGSLARAATGLAGFTAASGLGRRTATSSSLLSEAVGASLGNVSINVPAPQITIVTRDSALAEFIDVRIDGKAVRANRVVARKESLTL